MANRSYLYSINEVPVRGRKMTKKICGLSECAYESGLSTLAHLILVSAKTKPVKSIIWDVKDDIALMGDYATGLERLAAIKDRLDADAEKAVIQEGIDFLSSSKRSGKYFYLELGEVLELEDAPFKKQMREFIGYATGIDELIDGMIDTLNTEGKRAAAKAKKSAAGRTSRKSVTKSPNKLLSKCGFTHWSDCLYYDLNQSGRPVKKR